MSIIKVENVHLSESLMRLSYNLKSLEDYEAEHPGEGMLGNLEKL